MNIHFIEENTPVYHNCTGFINGRQIRSIRQERNLKKKLREVCQLSVCSKLT